MPEFGNSIEIVASPMAEAWRQAARDLDVKFVSPFALVDGEDVYWCAGLLPDFGSPKGTVICGRHAPEDAMDIADKLGYYTSGLSPHYYETYNRELFRDTLNDWGWTGEFDLRPTWYSQDYFEGR